MNKYDLRVSDLPLRSCSREPPSSVSSPPPCRDLGFARGGGRAIFSASSTRLFVEKKIASGIFGQEEEDRERERLWLTAEKTCGKV
ncbi:hypothetical protein KSP40_PGU000029 [Platanthera guangdongensis]|uniref:Uncharacterized protein n=1 Tax=Platanthera guangdongensis TaxID=2320717 RepID=A0ABR2M662_9ASPA